MAKTLVLLPVILAILLFLPLSSCAPPNGGAAAESAQAFPAADATRQRITPVVNSQYLPTVLRLINEANKSIDFIQLEWQYRPAVRRIQNALRAALKRGVSIRGLIDDRISFNVTSVGFLKEFGIDAKLDTPEKMTHNKLFIADGRDVLLGSTNITQNSMERNNETNVLISDRAIGGIFEDYFEKLWEDSAREPGIEPFSSGGVEVLFNRFYFTEVITLFDEAKNSISVLLYGMSYDDRNQFSKKSRLVDALVAASKRGVEVKVLLDKSDYNEMINRVNEKTKRHLEAGGVSVRFDDEHVTSHAKLIIADGAVVIGSMNWGYDALERRNECSVIIRDSEILKFFRSYFDTLWEGKPWPGEKAAQLQLRGAGRPAGLAVFCET